MSLGEGLQQPHHKTVQPKDLLLMCDREVAKAGSCHPTPPSPRSHLLNQEATSSHCSTVSIATQDMLLSLYIQYHTQDCSADRVIHVSCCRGHGVRRMPFLASASQSGYADVSTCLPHVVWCFSLVWTTCLLFLKCQLLNKILSLNLGGYGSAPVIQLSRGSGDV